MMALVAAGLVAAASPSPARSSLGCPRSAVRILAQSTPEFPDGAHPANPRVSFWVDIGSDGRIRRTALSDSSGDPAVDDAAAKALAGFRFAAPTAGCVTVSGAFVQGWTLPPESLASPPVAAGSTPPSRCGAPFVRPIRLPLPHRREVPGTAWVDLSLDANGRVTAVHLARSSGNAKSNYAATVAVRNGRYSLQTLPGCAPSATTYRMELTFR